MVIEQVGHSWHLSAHFSGKVPVLAQAVEAYCGGFKFKTQCSGRSGGGGVTGEAVSGNMRNVDIAVTCLQWARAKPSRK